MMKKCMKFFFVLFILMTTTGALLTGCAAGNAVAIPFRPPAKTNDIKAVTILTQVPKRAFEELGLIQLPVYRCTTGCSNISALDPKLQDMMARRAGNIGADALILRRFFTQEHCENSRVDRTQVAEGVAVRWSGDASPKRLTQ